MIIVYDRESLPALMYESSECLGQSMVRAVRVSENFVFCYTYGIECICPSFAKLVMTKCYSGAI